MRNWTSFCRINLLAAAIVLQSCRGNDMKLPEEEIPLPFYISADLSPHWIDEDSPAYDAVHRIADFSFIDQNGANVTHETVEGKVYIANFFFTTCPGVCRLMTGELLAVQEAFGPGGDSVLILSHSVMPWVDTVEQLKHFEQVHRLDGSMWKLLTGPKEALYGIARASYFADEGFGKNVTGSADFLHTENVMLIDRHRRIRGVYNGTSRLDIQRLIEDARQLLREP